MATDATGTPSSLGIPKYNTAVDSPSGKGLNAIVDSLDALILGRVKVTGAPVVGDVPVWRASDSTWRPSSVDTPTIAGQVVVATSIAGLGTATNGKIGLLRLGSTPYEFLEVIYDGTYAKWVSRGLSLMDSGAGGSTGPATNKWTHTFSGVGAVGLSAVDFWGFSDFVAAGLTPQFRITGRIANSNTAIGGSVAVDIGHANVNDTGPTATAISSGLSSIPSSGTSGVYIWKDSGWQGITNPGSPRSILDITATFAAAGAITLDFLGSVRMRWVSI